MKWISVFHNHEIFIFEINENEIVSEMYSRSIDITNILKNFNKFYIINVNL